MEAALRRSLGEVSSVGIGQKPAKTLSVLIET
jgi:hypothetical protein